MIFSSSGDLTIYTPRVHSQGFSQVAAAFTIGKFKEMTNILLKQVIVRAIWAPDHALADSSNRKGCGHVLVSLDIRSMDGQFSIETAPHS